MIQYLFFLGRDEDLAFLEVLSYLKARKMQYSVKKLDGSSLLLSIEKFDVEKAIMELAGTVKIGVECKFDDFRSYLKNKMSYVVGSFGGGDVDVVLKKLKALFREEKVKAVRKKFNIRKPSKDKNIDLEVLVYKNKLFRTVAVSDPRSYKKRDEKRPKFSGKEVISIRLAKMLINICGLKKGEVLLDPFCGIGTVLQEGLLLGLKVIGVDKDKKMVEAAASNLKWLGYKTEWKLFNRDNSKVSEFIKKVDGVVTEPYMGPYVMKIMKRKDALKVIKELRIIYSDLLKALRKIVKGRVVIVIPSFKTREGKNVRMNFSQIMEETGFRMVRSEKVKLPVYYYKKRSKIERYVYVIE